MERINEVQPGDKIVVIRGPTFLGSFGEENEITGNGVPISIKAKSWPFLMGEEIGSNIPVCIDVREITVSKVSDQYWEAFLETYYKQYPERAPKPVGHDVSGRAVFQNGAVQEEEKPKHRYTCPRCSSPMNESMTVGGHWKLVCNNCGFEGEAT